MEPKYFNRKEFLKNTGLGLVSIPSLLAAFAYKTGSANDVSKPDCILTPQTIEGPYYIQHALLRTDVRENKPGVDLKLKLKVVNVNTCQPVSNALVDIWHCDATGFYSGYPNVDPNGGGMPGGPGGPGGFPPGPGGFPPGGPPPPGGFNDHDSSFRKGFPSRPDFNRKDSSHKEFPRNDSSMRRRFPTPGENGMPGGFPPPGEGEGGMHASPSAPAETFLRGVQVTDANGEVKFLTIYPGWYAGRAVHIHCKVFLDKKSVVTTQFLMPQQFSNELHAANQPYKTRVPIPFTNENDMIANMAGGEEKVLLNMKKDKQGSVGTLVLGIRQ